MGETPSVHIDSFQPGDADSVAHVFHAAVREGAAARYDAAQRGAWSPEPRTGDWWMARLDGKTVRVAREGDRVVGFITLEPPGWIDLLYVLPQVMGTGVAAALYGEIESLARQRGLSALGTHASHLARPFFERRGWQVVARREVVVDGVAMENWEMRVSLS